MTAPKLIHAELMLDYLVPAGREKFRLDEVARILSDDSGKPVSVQSIRNGLDSGVLLGSRFNFSAKGDDVERHRVQWLTRSYLRIYERGGDTDEYTPINLDLANA